MVILEIKNRVGYITLNRPEKKNALNSEFVIQLKNALINAKNNEKIKVIILNANGTTFCAGADLAYLQQLQNNTFEENLADSNSLKELFEIIYFMPKIIIAQIEGNAIAGGCGLANVCDLVYAIPEANFGYTEVKIGFIPAIVMTFLIRKIGESRAKELLLTGNLISTQQAYNWSLVNNVFEKEIIHESVFEIANQLCLQNSGEAMGHTKSMIAQIQNLNISDALNYAAKENAKARSSDDCKNGINSFLNKTKMIW